MSEALDLVRAKSRQTRSRILVVVSDLSDEQLQWRPAPRAHSTGFTLWHTARADDNVQADLTGEGLEWESGGYAARWHHPDRGVGTGWDDEKAAALPLPPKSDLLAYVRRVFERVDAALDGVDAAAFARPLRSRFMNGESTYGEVVLSCISHDNRHLGEMEYIKGLLGLKGTATV
jgi:uncharacterized damage-inducible protein DinB